MRISDWSSDVCSSDLEAQRRAGIPVPCLRRVHPVPVRALACLQQEVDRRRGAARRRAASEASGVTEGLAVVAAFGVRLQAQVADDAGGVGHGSVSRWVRSEEHTSELQSLMRISYAVFCLKKKKTKSN